MFHTHDYSVLQFPFKTFLSFKHFQTSKFSKACKIQQYSRFVEKFEITTQNKYRRFLYCFDYRITSVFKTHIYLEATEIFTKLCLVLHKRNQNYYRTQSFPIRKLFVREIGAV